MPARRARAPEKQARPAARRRIDTFEIASGRLGPVPPCMLEIRPLTVLVGRQGTGKSLVAQVLYALDELPYLTQYLAAQQRGGAKLDAQRLFASIVNQLRSAERPFAEFAVGTTRISWGRGAAWAVPVRETGFAFTMSKVGAKQSRRTTLTRSSEQIVTALRNPGLRPIRHAVFVPTERMVVSQLRSAIADRLLSLPITYELFADWLEIAAAVHDDVDDPRAAAISDLSREALSGEVRRVGDAWKWMFDDGKRTRGRLDIDMASSGQRANWSLGYLARSLFALRGGRDFAEELTLFVEEPELHLHPAAQVAMSHILAHLVNAGFRVVVTTHSLTIVYALNNLLLAHRLGDRRVKGLPDPALRLSADDVSVYGFGSGEPRQLVDRERAFIDEHELGDVGAELGAEMNRMLNLEPE